MVLVEKPATLITYRQPKPLVKSLLSPYVCYQFSDLLLKWSKKDGFC